MAATSPKLVRVLFSGSGQWRVDPALLALSQLVASSQGIPLTGFNAGSPSLTLRPDRPQSPVRGSSHGVVGDSPDGSHGVPCLDIASSPDADRLGVSLTPSPATETGASFWSKPQGPPRSNGMLSTPPLHPMNRQGIAGCLASSGAATWHCLRGLSSLVGTEGGAGTTSRQTPREEDRSPYVGQPWTYTLTEIPPDTTAAILSEESKEAMYSLHKQSPEEWTPARLAKEYRIREQRAHAILWLKELEKRAEAEQGSPLDDSIAKAMSNLRGSVAKAAAERHVSIFPSAEVDAIEDDDERITRLLQESAEEEKWKVEEFVERLNFNKLQVHGMVKVNPLHRRRPKEGWSYVVEELGDEGRRGRAGGRRHVVGPDGTKRELNDFEKQFLLREKTKRRRRIVP